MPKKTKYTNADINKAIRLLQHNGFDVNRVWFNKEHIIRGYISGKEVYKACEWLKDNQSGCVHYDMFRFNGMVYSIVFGVWGDEDDPGIYRKIARQSVDSALQCGFDIDWDMPVRLDKDGNETADVWDNMDRVCGLNDIPGKSVHPIWSCHASQANQWILDVYQKVLEGECR